MPGKTLIKAAEIWSYFASFNEPRTADAIVVCCSYDLRICDYACQLAQKHQIPQIVFSGKSGNWTDHLWDVPEAQVFKKRALNNGIHPDHILTEEKATNIGENIAFSRKLLPESKSVTFITKPNTILRVKLTVPVQWPGITAYTSCPQFIFPEQVSHIIGVFGVISEMVGDIERIMKYPELGYQIQHDLPENILAAYDYLVSQGYTDHLMDEN